MKESTKRLSQFLVLSCILFAASLPLFAQVEYQKEEVMIEMRDGIELHTEIYRPTGSSEELPFLITRTPYGLRHIDGIHSYLSRSYKDLADEQYIFVFQDIRGRYKSEGEFVMLRPSRNRQDASSIDESTDTYDTIDWLLKNIKNHSGKVGLLGISYGGWLTVVSLIEPHPALTAISPQASPADMYLGDDFLHNGALRLSPAFGYAALMESAKTNAPFQFDQYDTYEFFLDMGPLENANKKYFKEELPSWNNFMQHPNYDRYWKELNVDHNLREVPVPVLNVAGWWDAEDFYGPMKIYEKLESLDKNDHNFLVVGPWRHGGWAGDLGDQLGAIQFDQETGVYFRQQIQARFFAYYLKGKNTWSIDEALTFQTGSNQWVETSAWPRKSQVVNQKLYFQPSKSLSFSFDPEPKKSFDQYISDPDNPVPYAQRPIRGFWQHSSSKALWKVEDQRFVDGRPDVLSFETQPLEEDVTVSGKIIAKLFASTTGTDSDWIIKLIDVYPEDFTEMSGYQLMIADEVLRGKYRDGFHSPKIVPSNQVVEYTIDLNSRNHTFLKGHKIMVQVQSTWFPLVDRNPQNFVNIPTAKADDYRITTQRIYRSKEYPSHIILPVTTSQ